MTDRKEAMQYLKDTLDAKTQVMDAREMHKGYMAASHYVSRLPRYADHPANGDHAGDPFIPMRDPCIVLSRLGEAIDRSPFWHSGKWLSSLVTGYEDGEPTRFETGQFFIAYEAAVMFAEETDDDQ